MNHEAWLQSRRRFLGQVVGGVAMAALSGTWARGAFAEELARRIRERARESQAKVRVLGPSTAPMAKLRGEYRHQVHLHSTDGALLRSLVRESAVGLKSPDGVLWTVDVDPLDMM